ncbi:MAG TPA: YciI family protein [Actinophytocola sp.]|nr:YciI family protein [Actinophytocola sp.]
MRFLLLIGGEPVDGAASSKEICAEDEAVAWVEEMTRRGVYVSGELLRPAEQARTVRVRDDEVLLADGPFAETKEQIGGLSVIECADLAEAVEVASTHPVARFGMVEVRPLWQP